MACTVRNRTWTRLECWWPANPKWHQAAQVLAVDREVLRSMLRRLTKDGWLENKGRGYYSRNRPPYPFRRRYPLNGTPQRPNRL